MLVTQALQESARRWPNAPALRRGDRRLTWRELELQSRAMAEKLRECGVGPGERVVIEGHDEAERALAVWAVLRSGAAFVVLDSSLPPAAREELVVDADPRLVIDAAELTRSRTPSDSPLLEVHPHAPAGLIYTSGSSGRPKAVVLDHAAMGAAATAIAGYLRLVPDDRILNCLPLSFDYGLYQLFLSAVTSAEVVLEPGATFVGEVMASLRQGRVTTLPGVPSLFGQLLERPGFHAEGLPDLVRFTNTGAHLPVPMVRELRRRFPAAEIYLMYGLTECKRVSYLPPREVDLHPTSVGYPMEGCEVMVVDENGRPLPPGDEGELVVRGANLMMGYWRRPEETARALRPGPWPGETCLWTGDRFRQDEAGRLYCLGRRDDVFKSRGQKVAPAAIEAVLEAHETVLEAVVVGRPDPHGDHEVHAFVVAPGADERSLIHHCRSRLPRHQWPSRVHLLHALPRNRRGKVDRQDLRLRLEPSSEGAR